jgi:hypothetical protein
LKLFICSARAVPDKVKQRRERIRNNAGVSLLIFEDVRLEYMSD